MYRVICERISADIDLGDRGGGYNRKTKIGRRESVSAESRGRPCMVSSCYCLDNVETIVRVVYVSPTI